MNSRFLPPSEPSSLRFPAWGSLPGWGTSRRMGWGHNGRAGGCSQVCCTPDPGKSPNPKSGCSWHSPGDTQGTGTGCAEPGGDPGRGQKGGRERDPAAPGTRSAPSPGRGPLEGNRGVSHARSAGSQGRAGDGQGLLGGRRDTSGHLPVLELKKKKKVFSNSARSKRCRWIRGTFRIHADTPRCRSSASAQGRGCSPR